MSEVLEAIEKRRSVRKYKDEPVPKEDLKEMVRVATWTPMAFQQQLWKFVVVTNDDTKKKMADISAEKIEENADVFGAGGSKEITEFLKKAGSFFKNAPAVIAVFYEPTEAVFEGARNKGMSEDEIKRALGGPDTQTIGASIQNLLLAAHAMGYGACWLTLPVLAYKEIEDILGVEDPWKLAAVIPVGKPAEDPEPLERKPIEETFTLIE